MRTLVPMAALEEAARDVEKARLAGEANADPNGLGWTDVYIAQSPSIDYSEIPLSLNDAANVLSGHFPRIRDFVATASAGFSSKEKDPYGSYESDAQCYGTGADCFVKLEHKDGIVRQIWFECRTKEQSDVLRLRDALVAINATVASAIIDYWLDAAGAISNTEFLNRYFEELWPETS